MAEVLGLVASVFSVVSLTIQLGDSLRIACEFWDSIEDGPDDMRRISMELRLLANILYQIQREYEAGAVDRGQEQMLMDALAIAKGDIDGLAAIVTELSRKIGLDQKSLKRKWGRIQVVLKGAKIAKLKAYIESAKSILTLLQSTRAHTSLAQMNGKLDLVTATFSSMTLAQPNLEFKKVIYETRTSDPDPSWQSSPERDIGLKISNKHSVTSLNAHVVKFSLRSTTSRIIDDEEGDDDQKEAIVTPTKYVVNMTWKFLSCRRAFKLTFSNNFDAFSLNTMRRRPDTSQIFEFCMDGNALEVRKLFRSGRASVFDVDADGWTLLHYACRNGHPELIRLLVSEGADVYQEDDIGRTAVHELRLFDIDEGIYSQSKISDIVNTMITKTSFNPFEWVDLATSSDTFSLYHGLPYDSIRSLLTADMFTPINQLFDFIHYNLCDIESEIEGGLESIDLLLTHYANLRGDKATKDEWPHWSTLVQFCIGSWLCSTKHYRKGREVVLLRALELTDDLFQIEDCGTPLDTVTNISAEMVQPWLELLSTSSIDVKDYVAYEQSQHLDGVVHGRRSCCRIIYVKFELGSEVGPSITQENICNPSYVHLDPEYRCEAYRRREDCICKIDPLYINEDGRQIPPLPGSFTPGLKCNQDLSLVLRFRAGIFCWMYVDVVGPRDTLWEDMIPWWAPESKGESTDGTKSSGSESTDESDASECKENDEFGNGERCEGSGNDSFEDEIESEKDDGIAT